MWKQGDLARRYRMAPAAASRVTRNSAGSCRRTRRRRRKRPEPDGRLSPWTGGSAGPGAQETAAAVTTLPQLACTVGIKRIQINAGENSDWRFWRLQRLFVNCGLRRFREVLSLTVTPDMQQDLRPHLRQRCLPSGGGCLRHRPRQLPPGWLSRQRRPSCRFTDSVNSRLAANGLHPTLGFPRCGTKPPTSSLACLFPLATSLLLGGVSAVVEFPRQTCTIPEGEGPGAPFTAAPSVLPNLCGLGDSGESRFLLAYGRWGWHGKRHPPSAAFSQPQRCWGRSGEIRLGSERSDARRHPPCFGPGAFCLSLGLPGQGFRPSPHG